ncbi:hypothetical protein D3C77_270200 [compost metagenome]
MAGQFIQLPGVVAAASVSAPRISMSAADIAAAKISSLMNVVSASQLTPVPGGGVSGRCRNTGQPLTMKGVGQAALQVSEVSGKKVLSLASITPAGLALPPGSLMANYTAVLAFYLSPSDWAGTAIVNLLSGFTAADAYSAMPARYYGVGSASNSGTLRASGAPAGAAVGAQVASAGWHLAIIDMNSATKVVSVAIDQIDSFSTGALSAGYAPGAMDFLEIGYHLNSISLVTSSVADLYTFNGSLLSTNLGKQQLGELVGALKAEYGIA